MRRKMVSNFSITFSKSSETIPILNEWIHFLSFKFVFSSSDNDALCKFPKFPIRVFFSAGPSSEKEPKPKTNRKMKIKKKRSIERWYLNLIWSQFIICDLWSIRMFKTSTFFKRKISTFLLICSIFYWIYYFFPKIDFAVSFSLHFDKMEIQWNVICT